jgi:flagellar biosynthesis/type III secretory pathway protein FliH
MYAEDLHSAGGFNSYASAMSLAADEIVKLREYAVTIEADLVATIDQRDELGSDKARWWRMSEVFAKQAAEYKAEFIMQYEKGYAQGVETALAKIKEEAQRCYLGGKYEPR